MRDASKTFGSIRVRVSTKSSKLSLTFLSSTSVAAACTVCRSPSRILSKLRLLVLEGVEVERAENLEHNSYQTERQIKKRGSRDWNKLFILCLHTLCLPLLHGSPPAALEASTTELRARTTAAGWHHELLTTTVKKAQTALACYSAPTYAPPAPANLAGADRLELPSVFFLS